MSPISQYLTLTKIDGSESLSRFNLFNSIAVQGQQAEGYSSGQALQAIRETAATVLPEGYGYEFGSMSREEASIGNMTTVVFPEPLIGAAITTRGISRALICDCPEYT